VTEDEARGKWCPFARRASTRSDYDSVVRAMASINRIGEDGRPDPECRCVASDCMAWRRVDLLRNDGYCGLTNNDR
jgi:hypothetical protein